MEEEQREFALEYAGFWIRLGAFIIDGIALAVINFAITVLFRVSSIALPIVFMRHIFLPHLGIWSFIGLVVEIAYFAGFWVWRGQTPGKMAAGVKIIRKDGSPLTWGCALLRYLGYIVSMMTLFIGFIWIAFDSRKQGIHDKIADTYVVKLPVRKVVLTKTYAGCAIK